MAEALLESVEGRKLALDVLSRKRSEVLARIPENDTPGSSFYAFTKQTRKKYFTAYLGLLQAALEDRDTTDFLGNETFQSYSHAKNGYACLLYTSPSPRD